MGGYESKLDKGSAAAGAAGEGQPNHASTTSPQGTVTLHMDQRLLERLRSSAVNSRGAGESAQHQQPQVLSPKQVLLAAEREAAARAEAEARERREALEKDKRRAAKFASERAKRVAEEKANLEKTLAAQRALAESVGLKLGAEAAQVAKDQVCKDLKNAVLACLEKSDSTKGAQATLCVEVAHAYEACASESAPLKTAKA